MNYKRWLQLMSGLGLNENSTTFNNLVKAYSEPHRRYHTLEHIGAMLKHFDCIKHIVQAPLLVELGIWFHDAIYQPFSSSNEADSADWAYRFLKENNAPESDAQCVFNLVMVTQHNSMPADNDQAILVDIDLSILGCESETYEQFEKDIRFEYKRVPYFLYKKKRKEILKQFLDRETIYQTAFFRDKYERRARSNMELALHKL